MEEIRSNALVLRKRAFAESDLIVVLLTERAGKVSAIARGARRSRRRFAGPVLDPFQEVSVRMTRRPNAELLFLHECRLLRSHHGVAADPDCYAWANYLAELCERMVPEHDPCTDLYALLLSTLAALSSQAPAEATAHHFILGLLDRSGWNPNFDRCGLCGADGDSDISPILDERGSGIICARHEAERLGRDPNDPRFRPSRRVIEAALLEYLRAARRQAVVTGADPRITDLASALLDRLIDLHLTRPLKSRAFLAHLRATRSDKALEKSPGSR